MHRDLKPGNVLLDSADGMVIPKVADFGLAKILSDEDSGHSKTRSGVAMGTPQFMAPEQIRNAKDVDQRADIFALGCILYTILVGRLPFDDADLLELYNKIATGRFQQPEEFLPELPKYIGDTIRACLEVDRNKRVKDCDAVRAMLYGDDVNISGGVRLSMETDLSPPPRVMPLVEARTRMPTAAERGSESIRPTSMPTMSSVGAVTYGALAIGGFGLLAVIAVAAVGGTWWWWQSQQNMPNMPSTNVIVPEPAATVGAPTIAAPEPEAAPVPAVAEAPAPAVKPATKPSVKPVAKPVEVVVPEVAAPKEAASGRLVVVGEIESFSVSAGGHKFAPGNIPAGTYQATFQFAGGVSQHLEGVTVKAGQTTTVSCRKDFSNCRVQ